MIIDCGCTRDSRSGRLHRALFGPAPPRRAMRARDEQAHFRRLRRGDQAALAPQTGHRSCPRTHAGGYEREVGSAHGTCRPAAVCARTRAYARGCGRRAPSAPYFAGFRAGLAGGISISIVCAPLSAVATTPASRSTCCTPVVGTSRARARGRVAGGTRGGGRRGLAVARGVYHIPRLVATARPARSPRTDVPRAAWHPPPARRAAYALRAGESEPSRVSVQPERRR